MKQPKRLTRDQKECLTAHGLRPEAWSLIEETEFYYKIISERTGAVKMVDKFVRRKRTWHRRMPINL